MNENKKMYLDCSCGCSSLNISYWEPFDDDDGIIFLSHHIDSFYALQRTFLDSLKERLKILWTVVILGREHVLYEISLESKEKIAEFKEFVSKIDEERAFEIDHYDTDYWEFPNSSLNH